MQRGERAEQEVIPRILWAAEAWGRRALPFIFFSFFYSESFRSWGDTGLVFWGLSASFLFLFLMSLTTGSIPYLKEKSVRGRSRSVFSWLHLHSQHLLQESRGCSAPALGLMPNPPWKWKHSSQILGDLDRALTLNLKTRAACSGDNTTNRQPVTTVLKTKPFEQRL